MVMWPLDCGETFGKHVVDAYIYSQDGDLIQLEEKNILLVFFF